jgi:hypothetical protein
VIECFRQKTMPTMIGVRRLMFTMNGGSAAVNAHHEWSAAVNAHQRL